MIVHLVLLVLLLIFRITSAVRIFSGSGNNETMAWYDTSSLMTFGANSIVFSLALICCIIYLWNGYSKKAAVFYKAFLVLTAVASMLSIAVVVDTDAVNSNVVKFLELSVFIMAAKIVLLLVLAFWKDLGKRNTWIIFCVILALDLIFGFLFEDIASVRLFRAGSAISRLLVDGTIAFAILGKYEDKESRGTK